MIWVDNRTLSFEGDGPSALHPQSLAAALGAIVGKKPGVRFLGGDLVSLHFEAEQDASAQASVVAAVAMHNGASALAVDSGLVAQAKSARATKRDELDTLRQKRREGKALTQAEQARAIDLLLGV